VFLLRLSTPRKPTRIFTSGSSPQQQSHTDMILSLFELLRFRVRGLRSLSQHSCAAQKPPTLIFDDFEYDLAVGPRGDCAKHDAERLGRTPLLAYHPA